MSPSWGYFWGPRERPWSWRCCFEVSPGLTHRAVPAWCRAASSHPSECWPLWEGGFWSEGQRRPLANPILSSQEPGKGFLEPSKVRLQDIRSSGGQGVPFRTSFFLPPHLGPHFQQYLLRARQCQMPPRPLGVCGGAGWGLPRHTRCLPPGRLHSLGHTDHSARANTNQ